MTRLIACCACMVALLLPSGADAAKKPSMESMGTPAEMDAMAMPAGMDAMPAMPVSAMPAMPAMPAMGNDDDDDDDDDFDTSMSVMTVKVKVDKKALDAAKKAVKKKQKPGFVEYLGRMHPLVVHMPIAWIILLVLIDIGTFAMAKEAWKTAGYYVLMLTTASMVPAIIAGLILESEKEPLFPKETKEILETHELLGYVTGGILVGALVLRFLKKNALEGALKWAYLGLIVLAAGLTAFTGHLGGKMVFGSNWLPF